MKMSKKLSHRGKGSQAGASRANQLVEGLHQWAVNMGLPENQLPPEKELRVLAGTHGSSLNYIIKHISSPRSVQSAKKNILLQSHEVAVKRQGLLAEREELARELKSLQLAVTQLETDITRLQSDIAILEKGVCVTRDEAIEVSRKRALLLSHCVRCDHVVRTINELNQRIKQRKQLFMVSAKEPSYFTRAAGETSSIEADGSKTVVLESACKRDVRLVTESLVALEGHLPSSPREDTSGKREALRNHIWTKTESLLCDHAPGSILLSLSELTQEAAHLLHCHTSRINLRQDAKSLKYHYDQTSGVSDITPEPALLHTVQDHLTQLQVAHVARGVETERINQSAEALHHTLREVRGQVASQLSQLYQGDEEGARLARRCFQLDVEVAGYKSSLGCLDGVCVELSEAREQQRAMLDTLRHKRDTIQQFTQKTVNNQEHIQRLVKLNSAARTRLLRQQTETGLYLREGVASHETPVVTLCGELMDSVRTELEALSSLSLSRLLSGPAEVR